MRIIVLCEFSQIVTQALLEAGHDAYSCDLRETEGDTKRHIQDDARKVARNGKWDAAVAHPECTHLTLAGARWFYDNRFPNKEADREDAIKFWLDLWYSEIPIMIFENPQPLQCVMDDVGRYDQKVQPWQFGDNESKGVCLWYKGTDKRIKPTVLTKPANIEQRVWRLPPGPDRAKERSRFFPGIAKAFARDIFND